MAMSPLFAFAIFLVLLFCHSCAGFSVPSQMSAVPKLIVFDLDKTLWNPHLISFCGGFRKDGESGRVLDRLGEEIKLYPDVEGILKVLRTASIFQETSLAIASRTSKTAWAHDVLDLITSPEGDTLDSLFQYKKVFPGSKTSHFKKLRKDSKVDYDEMLFFDDWIVNTIEISNIGVTCQLCDQAGLTWEHFEEGLMQYSNSKAGKEAKNSALPVRNQLKRVEQSP
mmetsp:Transcript_1350/g.2135  ORF Transcript_1350/g.2135 Transcript_1350/m.2135 type:complete len:225 (-) Transcript_1350:337-1011(-)